METASSDPSISLDWTPPVPLRGGVAPALAGLMAGSALIHFVMAPIHAGASQLEGALFAAAGWTQAVIAVLLLIRPRRLVLITGIAVNLVLLGVWAYSRTKGLPFGAHPNVAEPVDTADLAAALMQGSFVLGATASLLNRTPARAPAFASIALGGVALGVASMVIVSPTIATHDHGLIVDPARAALEKIRSERCDAGVNPEAYWLETRTAGVDSVFGQGHLTPTAVAPVAADGHQHGGTGAAPQQTIPAPDRSREANSQEESRLTQLSKGVGEANDAQLVTELAKISDQEYETWLRSLHSIASAHTHASTLPTAPSANAPDDNGGHGGHVGPISWTAITDKHTCSVLRSQLDLARQTALTYPTAADAKAAGWRKVTTYVPGIAAHYMNFGLVDNKFEVDKPEMILYDGEGDDARVVGLSYYIIKPGDDEPKIGFAGGNDHFHRHVGLCVKGALVIGDSQTTKEQCEARGGSKQGGGAGWMSHAWVVPGCESPWGVFSGANPLLESQLSAQSGKNGGGCSASSVRARYDLSSGRSKPAATAATSESAGPK